MPPHRHTSRGGGPRGDGRRRPATVGDSLGLDEALLRVLEAAGLGGSLSGGGFGPVRAEGKTKRRVSSMSCVAATGLPDVRQGCPDRISTLLSRVRSMARSRRGCSGVWRAVWGAKREEGGDGGRREELTWQPREQSQPCWVGRVRVDSGVVEHAEVSTGAEGWRGRGGGARVVVAARRLDRSRAEGLLARARPRFPPLLLLDLALWPLSDLRSLPSWSLCFASRCNRSRSGPRRSPEPLSIASSSRPLHSPKRSLCCFCRACETS